MTRWGTVLLTAGALLFIGVLASQGLPAVLSALAAAGWGLLLVAAFQIGRASCRERVCLAV